MTSPMHSRIQGRGSLVRRGSAGFSFVEILDRDGDHLRPRRRRGRGDRHVGREGSRVRRPRTPSTKTKASDRELAELQSSRSWPPGDVDEASADIAGIGRQGPRARSNKTNERHRGDLPGALLARLQGRSRSGRRARGRGARSATRDEDELRKAVNKRGTKALKEIVDGWGNPLVYFHSSQYKRYADSGQTYSSKDYNSGEEMDVEARPWQREDGTFYNPLTFQVYSMGPDGEPNTEDDVTTWTKED